ncbi:hypothetical protein TanjilG_14731 [Lupinus angustifolius]|nr:hypothetical protein TanjilG_14731 [Lupinus angustifolius]
MLEGVVTPDMVGEVVVQVLEVGVPMQDMVVIQIMEEGGLIMLAGVEAVGFTLTQSCCRSPDRNAPLQNSKIGFHQAIMQHSGGDNDRNKSFISPSSPGGGRYGVSYSNYKGEMEEGMIVNEGMISTR